MFACIFTARRYAKDQIFPSDFLHHTRIVWPTTTKFGRVIHVEGRISSGSAPPLHSPIFRGPLYLSAYSLTQNDQLDVLTHVWRGLIYRGQPRPQPKGAGSQHSPILGIPFYLCVQPLTQNYPIWRANVLVLRGSAMPPVPALPILGFSSNYVYTLRRRTTEFGVNICDDACFGVRHAFTYWTMRRAVCQR